MSAVTAAKLRVARTEIRSLKGRVKTLEETIAKSRVLHGKVNELLVATRTGREALAKEIIGEIGPAWKDLDEALEEEDPR